MESSRHTSPRGPAVSTKPFPNRTGIFQRIRLSITSELFLEKVSNDYPFQTTRDCGPSPCERCYRLPGWTSLHRLLQPLCPCCD